MMKKTAVFRSITIIVGGLFLAELISMGLIAVFDSLSYFKLSVLDATLMIFLATPLLYFFVLRPLLHAISEREAEIVQREKAEDQVHLRTTALDAAANGIIITDRTGKILWVNQAFVHMTGYAVEEIINQSSRMLNSGKEDVLFFKELWNTILSGKVWHGEMINRRKDGSLYIDEMTITPVLNASGEVENFIAIQQDVTDHKRADSIIHTRLRLMQYADTHSLDELLQFTLDEIEALTGSQIGFFHFLERDEKTLRLQSWSTNTLQKMCTAEGKGTHYNLDQAGIWADCIRQRKPIIHNDYESLKNHKRLPEGHAAVVREATVPVIRNDKVVAVLGVGNKQNEYTAIDLELISSLADFAWDIIEHSRAEIALQESEEKFRILADWTYDWEMWIDPQNKIVYISPSCERVTGYQLDEFVSNPNLLQQIVHPDDRSSYEEHRHLLHDETAGVSNIEYRIIARDGSEHWIDHICRPLFGADNRYLGRRVSNRDITERKRTEREIEERNQREKMLNQTIHSMQIDLARDLHDTIGQNISFLRMKLDYLNDMVSALNPSSAADIKLMSDVANDSYDLLRGMLTVLQSGSTPDLYLLFSRYAEKITERSALKVNVSSQGTAQPLSAGVVRQLFYIFREALSNIEKHAQASEANVTIEWEENSLILAISDNGHGFEPAHGGKDGHYGLKFMRERAGQINGSLTVRSIPNSGTKVVIRVPMDNN